MEKSSIRVPLGFLRSHLFVEFSAIFLIAPLFRMSAYFVYTCVYKLIWFSFLLCMIVFFLCNRSSDFHKSNWVCLFYQVYGFFVWKFLEFCGNFVYYQDIGSMKSWKAILMKPSSLWLYKAEGPLKNSKRTILLTKNCVMVCCCSATGVFLHFFKTSETIKIEKYC